MDTNTPANNQNDSLGDGITVVPAVNTTEAQTEPMQKATQNPDSETANRIKNLAEVGSALFHSSDEISFQTQFFTAKESLNRFKAGIDKLALDPKSKQGMTELIEYLSKKIDRRLQSSENDGAIPTV